RRRQTLPGNLARRSVARCLELQGFPPDFLDEAPFTVQMKYRPVGNGVPLPMGRAVARAVKRAMGYPLEEATASRPTPALPAPRRGCARGRRGEAQGLGWCVTLEWGRRDVWIGLYWDRSEAGSYLDVYLCGVPCLPVHLVVWGLS